MTTSSNQSPINGLTKENFWNHIEGKYPLAFKHFNRWIDEYKKEVRWDQLFSNGQYYLEPDNTGGHRINVKFHDLPFEMQVGIILRYIIELVDSTKNFVPRLAQMRVGSIDYFKIDLEYAFDVLEDDLKISN